ncbi:MULTISPECIES: L-threonine dehydrogenase [Bacillales]|uniref:zinc-dependent alcohol dehydrogenase n=1 Tax=Bacillales TaxID=1385 RepID=UPI0006A797F7|nr:MULTISPECIES: L-threonine dehydrogenase [Bacillales]OBZ13247.1 Zn-dependent alcohol dehydrogenase [Bacillus sp. FJAT-26390]
MEAIVWSRSNRLELITALEPQIGSPWQVKVEIAMTGICGTDLAVAAGKERGDYDVIRGHEAAGVVVEVGREVSSIRVGDRVVIDPNKNCGRCRFCRRDKPHLCSGVNGDGMAISGITESGTFARFFVTDEQFVHLIPDHMTWEQAVFIEPLACVLHNYNEAQVRTDDAVLVLGSGPMGLLCQIVGKRRAGFVAATEVNPHRLQQAASVADVAIHPELLNEAIVSKWLGERKFDVVIDAVGNQFHTAERFVDRGGRIVPFGIHAGFQHTFKPTSYLQQGIKVIGAGEYLNTFQDALKLASELNELDGMVTKRYRLDEHEIAIAELLNVSKAQESGQVKETMKTVFIP